MPNGRWYNKIPYAYILLKHHWQNIFPCANTYRNSAMSMADLDAIETYTFESDTMFALFDTLNANNNIYECSIHKG